jgi:hypothetical protein
MLLAIIVGFVTLAAGAIAGQVAPLPDPGHVTLSLDNLLLHILPAISAGAFAWAGARFTIKNHSGRIARLEGHGSWNRRKTEKLETVHLMRHPEDKGLLEVEPIDPGRKAEGE